MRRLALTALVILAGAVSSGGACETYYTVRGRVTTCTDHHPIPHARVLLRLPSNQDRASVTSGASGRFEARLNSQPTTEHARLSARAEGYDAASQEVHHSADEEQNICLQPVGGAPPE